MRCFTLILAGLLPALAGAQPAFAACTAAAHPALDVLTEEAPVVLDRSRSIGTLSKMGVGPEKPGGLEGYDYALGLTENRFHHALQARIRTVTRNGTACATLAAATVTLRWEATVHIAAELAPGGCFSRAVEAHEQRHVETGRAFLARARALAEAALAEAAAEAESASDEAAAEQALWHRTNAAVEAAVAEAYAEEQRAQAAIDTPQEYDKVPAACGKVAFQKLLRGTLAQ